MCPGWDFYSSYITKTAPRPLSDFCGLIGVVNVGIKLSTLNI